MARPGTVVASLIGLGLAVVSVLVVAGQLSFVTTRGTSMEPRFHTGDLAVLRTAPDYGVGDVAAYHSKLLETVVLHRITAVHGGRYTFKGDHNTWTDPERPDRSALVGVLVARVPQGGAWLSRVSSPAGLAALCAVLVATAGTTQLRRTTRRRRRRRRTMAQHARRQAPPGGFGTFSGPARVVAVVAGVSAVLGLLLAVPAWLLSPSLTEPSKQTAHRTMTYSYTASVRRSPAYDGTTVHSPEPVFRRVASSLDVRYSYSGPPGTIAPVLRLTMPGGWHSEQPVQPVQSGPTSGTVRLDLQSIDRRVRAAAAVTGLSPLQVGLTLVTEVRRRGHPSFEPSLPMTLTPLRVGLAGSPTLLVVHDASVRASHSTRSTPRLVGLGSYRLPVPQTRILSAALLAGAALAGLVGWLLVRTRSGDDEADLIRRRWASLLVEVEPLSSPPGHRVVDVVDFPTLAKLAERYGLLVLHWSRSDVDTFVVQDEGVTYRYRTGSGVAERDEHVEAAAL